MPRDKSDAIRKAGRVPSALPTAFICLDPRKPVNRRRNLTNRGRPPLSVFCARGLFPLYWNIRPQHYGNYQGNGMSANAAPTRGSRGGGVAPIASIREIRDFNPFLFPPALLENVCTLRIFRDTAAQRKYLSKNGECKCEEGHDRDTKSLPTRSSLWRNRESAIRV